MLRDELLPVFPITDRSKKDSDDVLPHGKPEQPEVNKPWPADHRTTKSDENIDHGNIKSRNFTFRELATATKSFRQECLLREGGFGRVYRGTLPGSGQVVVVKQLDMNGMQGNRVFIAEISTLRLLNHENLVNLIGYCADGVIWFEDWNVKKKSRGGLDCNR